MPSKELAPLPESVEKLPEPREFARLLRERLEGEIQRVREERGKVETPEDVYQLTRGLQGYIEIAGEYRHAFETTVKIARQELEQELIDAVGEQGGIPNGSLTVPDLDGTDIKISKDSANEHTVDEHALYAAVAAEIVSKSEALENIQQLAIAAATVPDGEATQQLETFLADLLIAAQERVTALGSFKGQVTKVKRFAKDLAGAGADSIAGIVSKAVHTKSVYKGVKVSREERK